MPISRRTWLILLVLLLTALAYAPGLGGGYTFDDFPNIVDNTALHVSSINAAAWREAMWASPASDLQRPLASLSFALNHYFTGLDPLPMKVTNLSIHLCNGLLLFYLLRRIARVAVRSDGTTAVRDDRRSEWLALVVTAIWLLHPINLTAVLFVVQRMESLSQTFVLAGLLFYTGARRRQQAGQTGSFWRLWIGVPLCMILGIAAKESAALLPLFTLILEFTLLDSRGARRKELFAFYLVFLIVPGLIGLAWMLSRALAPEAYAHRAFTLTERLLTEPRVLLDYMAWILLPLPKFFSFFRDDYPFSTDLWHPFSTLPAIVLVAALLTFAVLIRGRRPLVALGLLWFFAAHALTATVFPLELAFEHRNYFASIGLLLAAADLLLPATGARTHLGLVRCAAIAGIAALCAFALILRAREWSDPVRLAVTEAALHPQSPRATYELGRTYVVLSGYRVGSPNIQKAIDALELAARVPRASILPEVALITVASRTGKPVDDAWWESIRAKLENRRPTVEDSSAIRSLTECQREGRCALNDRRTLDMYLAALRYDPPDAAVLYSYAIFAFNRMGDAKLALQLTRDAVTASRDFQYRINLANFLIDQGEIAEAKEEIRRLKSLDRLGSTDSAIALLERRILEMKVPDETEQKPRAH